MRRWVENSVDSDVACIPVFQSVNVLSQSAKWDVHFSVLEACEEARSRQLPRASRPRPAFTTTTHSKALDPIYLDTSLPFFVHTPTNQLNLATAPISDNIRAHTGTTLTRSHKHVYRRLPKSGLRRGV